MGLVGDRYQLLNKINEGGMGVAWRALDRLSGHVVTVKLVRSRRAVADPSSLRRAVASEFQVMASLRHPNIVSVLDYGFDREHGPFVAMELLEDARSIVSAGQGQPLTVQLDLLVQLLRAVSYLHSRSVLHRDLKPDNVLVIGGRAKVLDFGIAVSMDTASGQRDVRGTLAYIAPELLRRAASSSIASDLYSIGIITYTMFTGDHPFPGARPRSWWSASSESRSTSTTPASIPGSGR